MLNDRIRTGSDVIAAEGSGFAPKIAELEFFVAHYARVWRPPGLILADEIINHDPLELIGLIHHVMRKAKRMRYAARVGERLRTAAFVFCSRNTILRPYFHRHANDVVALLAQ